MRSDKSHQLVWKSSSWYVFHYYVYLRLWANNLQTGFITTNEWGCKNWCHLTNPEIQKHTSWILTTLGWCRSFIVLISRCTWNLNVDLSAITSFFFFYVYVRSEDKTWIRKRHKTKQWLGICLILEIAFHDHGLIDNLDGNVMTVGGVHSQLDLGKGTFSNCST